MPSPLAVRCHVGDPPAPFDVPAAPPAAAAAWSSSWNVPARRRSAEPRSERALRRIVAASAARAVRRDRAHLPRLTGYDRVMVYRFDEEGHGEVFSEERGRTLEAFLGNRYPGLRHPADRPAALRAQPRARAGRHRLHAGAAGAAAVAAHRRRPRHVAVLPAQHLADPRAISEEHGRRRDAGRVADGRRAAVGPGLLPPLRAALRASSRCGPCASCWPRRSARGSRRWRASREAQAELAVRRLEQRHDRGDLARRRLAQGAVRRRAVAAAAAARRPAPRCCSRTRS